MNKLEEEIGTLVRDITAVPWSKSKTKRLIEEFMLDYIAKEEVEIKSKILLVEKFGNIDFTDRYVEIYEEAIKDLVTKLLSKPKNKE